MIRQAQAVLANVLAIGVLLLAAPMSTAAPAGQQHVQHR